MNFFLATGEGTDIASMLMTFVPIVLIFVVFYFFLIRPESKRKKAALQMRNELIVGDEITTIGGIIGKIINISEDTITIETGADKARIRVMRWAVSSKGTQAAQN